MLLPSQWLSLPRYSINETRTGKFKAGASVAMDWYSIQMGEEILILITKTGNKCRPNEQLGLITNFTHLKHHRVPKFYEDEKGTGFPHV